mmetsp:Transcript_15210/g.48532  ORF Transcript_15210/g.48532 Transcript_15210/m.48532 type:complete len:279 (-) Transcript_15210:121-957(-)
MRSRAVELLGWRRGYASATACTKSCHVRPSPSRENRCASRTSTASSAAAATARAMVRPIPPISSPDLLSACPPSSTLLLSLRFTSLSFAPRGPRASGPGDVGRAGGDARTPAAALPLTRATSAPVAVPNACTCEAKPRSRARSPATSAASSPKAPTSPVSRNSSRARMKPSSTRFTLLPKGPRCSVPVGGGGGGAAPSGSILGDRYVPPPPPPVGVVGRSVRAGGCNPPPASCSPLRPCPCPCLRPRPWPWRCACSSSSPDDGGGSPSGVWGRRNGGG